MDGAAAIHHRLVMLGVRFDVQGNRLRFHPASAVTPELKAELAKHKEEIIRRLRESDQQRSRSFEPSRALRTVDGIPNPSLTSRWSRYADVLACPHCHWMDLVEADGWLRCVACDRLAWRADDESIERVDHQGSTVLPSSPPLAELIRQQEATEMAERDRRMRTRLEAARKRSAGEATPLLPTIQDQ